MVAIDRLLEPVEVLVEGLPGLPRGAVDALQLRLGLVAAPIGTGRPHQLECVEATRRRQVGPATQIEELVVAIRADGVPFDALAGIDASDDLLLEGLVSERLQRLVDGEFTPLEGLVGSDDLHHPVLDALEVVRREGRLDLEVVVEPVLDRRADRELRAREQVEHGLGHDVGGRVADDVATGFGVLRDDRHRRIGLDRPVQVVHDSVDGHRDRRLRQSRADVTRHLEARDPGVVGTLGAVGKCDGDGHGRPAFSWMPQGYRVGVVFPAPSCDNAAVGR